MSNDYELYNRKPYEVYIALSWFSAVFITGLGYFMLPGGNVLLVPLFILIGLTMQTTLRCLGLIKMDQTTDELSFLPVDNLLTWFKKDTLWFGWGFEWQTLHTQRAIDMILSGASPENTSKPGSIWIHNLNNGREVPIEIPIKLLEGHTVLFGTTGSGKTRAYELMLTQAIQRGDTIVVIDPKGDKDLRNRMQVECQRAGRDDAFLFFHPAFPRESIRLDPMRNFTRSTELASRIATLLSSEAESDAFTAFAHRTLNLIAQGLIESGKRPSIQQFRYYIEGGAEPLLIKAIMAYADRIDSDWRKSAEPYFIKAKSGNVKKIENITNFEWLAIIEWYKSTWSGGTYGSEALDGLISLVEHNRLHFSKMIASLIPLLNMLTSGDLGEILSPNEANIDDPRPIFDSSTIISGNHVLYIGLDALSDSIVSSAIGSIILADFASFAGTIYNNDMNFGRITLFVDEAAEVVNTPFIQILNKGRGAGFQILMATQTMADLVARLGDEAHARQIIANCNNLISLRVKDGETQKFIVEALGKTYVQTVQRSISNAVTTQDNFAHYSGNTGQTLTFNEHDLFPQNLLGMLPNFHYIASISGGRLIKGRIPIIT